MRGYRRVYLGANINEMGRIVVDSCASQCPVALGCRYPVASPINFPYAYKTGTDQKHKSGSNKTKILPISVQFWNAHIGRITYPMGTRHPLCVQKMNGDQRPAKNITLKPFRLRIPLVPGEPTYCKMCSPTDRLQILHKKR